MAKLRAYVFIDATNIIYGASRSGWRVDFIKLKRYLQNKFGVCKIFYYAGLDQGNKRQIKFYEKIQEMGYLLRLVPVKKFTDGSKKADVDSRLTFELMKYFSQYDLAIVMTGDGDYYWVLEYLLKEGKRVKLLAFKNSTARELRQLFKGEFSDLDRLKTKLVLKMR